MMARKGAPVKPLRTAKLFTLEGMSLLRKGTRYHRCTGMNARATKLRLIIEAFTGLLGMSLVCLITTAPCFSKAGFIRRCQVAWGFIPRRKDETALRFFRGLANPCQHNGEQKLMC